MKKQSISWLILASWLAWPTPMVYGTGLTWPTNEFLPTFSPPAPTIDCIDISSANGAEQDLFASLEGIVNRTQPRIACVSSSAEEGEFTWLNIHNLPYRLINGYSAILKYETNVTGLVVTDPTQPDTLNLATTIAGVDNELICDPSLLATLTNAPYNLPVKHDLRGKFSNKYQVYQYLYTHYWSQCTHRIFAGMETNGHGALRDYLVAVKSAVVWLDPGVSADAAALAPFISSMKPVGGVYMGWWPSENNGLQWIAQYGIPVIASDWFDNASLFSGVRTTVSIPPIPPAPPLRNKVCVSITLSDGDNVQYMQHHMKNNWDNAARGSVPIGWTVQPLAVALDPGMLNYYDSTATTNDCLVAGPSGAGYTRINYWSPANAAAYTKASNPYLRRSGLRAITVWMTVSSATGRAYATNCPTLLGLNDQSGGYYTTSDAGLPVIGFPGNDSYTSTEALLLSGITNAAAGWNGSAPMFIAVQGSGWSITPADCQAIQNSLNRSKYVVVRPDQLFLLYRQAAGLGMAGASPYVASQPESQLANVGTNVTFKVIAGGTAPLSYQWRLNGNNIAGATNSIYVRSNVQPSDAGDYSVLVTNSYGTATSAAALLMVNSGAPQFFTDIQKPFMAGLGQTFSSSVIAAGTSPLHYQWQFNGGNLMDSRRIAGAQSNVLTIAGVQPGDAGNYQIIITNNFGSLTSSVARLTVVGCLPVSFNGSGPGWWFNGSAGITASNVVTLTSPSGLGGNGSCFFQYPQSIGAWKASFTYQAGGNRAADGIAFVLQNDPRNGAALGGGGGQLGVGTPTPITPSIELELNLYSPNGVGYTVLTNGLTAAGGANGGYHLPGSINLTSGDPIHITVSYAQTQMALSFTDTVTRATFSTNLTVGDLTQLLGTNTAFAGFTGAYGASTSIQTISNFSFVSIPKATIQLRGAHAFILWPGAAAGYVPQGNPDLRTTGWSNVTNQDILTNGWNQVMLPTNVSRQFYRLILPPTP